MTALARPVLLSPALRGAAVASADLDIEGYRRRAELSIGVAIFPTDGADSAALLANAGAALDRAKEEGRGAIHFFAAASSVSPGSGSNRANSAASSVRARVGSADDNRDAGTQGDAVSSLMQHGKPCWRPL